MTSLAYPTTEQVLHAVKHTDTSEFEPIVKEWKKNFYTKLWSKLTTKEKISALKQLINTLTNNKIEIIEGKEYLYNTMTKTIVLGPSPSIISTLHEVGHCLWGLREIDACRFSVSIFTKVFPNEYKKLEWKGHMLVNKK